jgi:hypothetical protein
MNKKDIAIITFASGEPYLSESYNLEYLCGLSDINFVRYDLEWLHKTDFYLENKELLDSKKAGYCAWKPYIILDALKKYKKVLYLDSSNLFTKEHIFEYLDKDDIILSTEIFGMQNKYHTKHLTFQTMNCLSDNYLNANQVWAGVISANRNAKDFLNEWLYYCKIKDCISDEYDKLKEPAVKYCLYDQSVYSILYEKYNIRRQDNCPDGKYFYFADTREYPHRDIIKQVFGAHIMARQDNLIMQYAERYITNGSCCYDPRQYAIS